MMVTMIRGVRTTFTVTLMVRMLTMMMLTVKRGFKTTSPGTLMMMMMNYNAEDNLSADGDL